MARVLSQFTETDDDTQHIPTTTLRLPYLKTKYCPTVADLRAELDQRKPIDLTKIHSRKLLKVFQSYRSIDWDDDYDYRINDKARLDPMVFGLPAESLLLGPTRLELKAELSRRPHMPSKREGAQLRRLRALAGRTHGRADIF